MSLISGDSFTSATTLSKDYTFAALFQSSSGLTDASNLVLPATTLTYACYYAMFAGCTSLTSAPELSATTLTYSCYDSMFEGCTSLTVAPVLPATALTEACYGNMFYGCSSLNYIKCLATNISASYCTSFWLYGVSSTGTFVKNPNMSRWTSGESGIPTGWTVVDAS